MSDPKENADFDPYAPTDDDFKNLEKILEDRFAAFSSASGDGKESSEPVIIGNKGVLLAVVRSQQTMLETMLKKAAPTEIPGSKTAGRL